MNEFRAALLLLRLIRGHGAGEWWWLPGTGFPATLASRVHFGMGLTWCLCACTWVGGCTRDLCLWRAGGSGQGFASVIGSDYR